VHIRHIIRLNILRYLLIVLLLPAACTKCLCCYLGNSGGGNFKVFALHGWCVALVGVKFGVEESTLTLPAWVT